MLTKCGECRYWGGWFEAPYPAPDDFGACRRRSPVIGAEPHFPTKAVWPTTTRGDACGDGEPRDLTGEQAERAKVLAIKLDDLSLSVRSYNALKGHKPEILTLRDIVEMGPDKLSMVRSLGAKSRREIEKLMESYGLSFRTDRA